LKTAVDVAVNELKEDANGQDVVKTIPPARMLSE
jgi:hypothetical protein